jgi:hypothetical protein
MRTVNPNLLQHVPAHLHAACIPLCDMLTLRGVNVVALHGHKLRQAQQQQEGTRLRTVI